MANLFRPRIRTVVKLHAPDSPCATAKEWLPLAQRPLYLRGLAVAIGEQPETDEESTGRTGVWINCWAYERPGLFATLYSGRTLVEH
jgi:hypothetical protein